MVVFCLCLKDIHHEFLIHCMFLFSHKGCQYDPAEGKVLTLPGIVYVCNSHGASKCKEEVM